MLKGHFFDPLMRCVSANRGSRHMTSQSYSSLALLLSIKSNRYRKVPAEFAGAETASADDVGAATGLPKRSDEASVRRVAFRSDVGTP